VAWLRAPLAAPAHLAPLRSCRDRPQSCGISCTGRCCSRTGCIGYLSPQRLVQVRARGNSCQSLHTLWDSCIVEEIGEGHGSAGPGVLATLVPQQPVDTLDRLIVRLVADIDQDARDQREQCQAEQNQHRREQPEAPRLGRVACNPLVQSRSPASGGALPVNDLDICVLPRSVG
jgi:hypothetical protein